MSNKPQTAAPAAEAPAVAAEAPTLDLAALVAAAAARKVEEANPSRSRKVAYGIFETPTGYVIAVDYTAQGKVRMDSWGLYRKGDAGKVTRLGTFRRKVDALNHVDALTAAQPAAE